MITLKGVTSFRDTVGHTTMASVETVTVSADRVTHRIGPLGDNRAGKVIESEHPEVIRFLNQVIDARKAHEYRLTPWKSENSQLGNESAYGRK